ncbi:MAG: hypothetical protein Pg6B_10710 [Candidatus Azobacteroides pseudotrichonymphae]|nr:MAG: hypothetical protein Pg6B_10710 [Candidatus Azobacteroides pseudotrichonymphae]
MSGILEMPFVNPFLARVVDKKVKSLLGHLYIVEQKQLKGVDSHS